MAKDQAIRIRYAALWPILAVLMLHGVYFLEWPLHDYWDVLATTYELMGRRAELAEWLTFYWNPFVDQRMVFPKLMISLLCRLTNNQHYSLEVAVGFIARLGMLYLIWLMVRKTDWPEKSKSVAGLAAAFLIFWPILQPLFQQNWYSTQYAWTLTPGVLAIYLMDKFWGRWLGVAGGGLACAVSSFSHGTGLLLWLVIGLILLSQSGWSLRQKAVWWLLSLAAIAFFMKGLPTRTELGFPALTAILDSPLNGLSYFFKCFAAPFEIYLRRPHLQFWMGLAMALVGALPVFVLLRQQRLFSRAAFPWLALTVWCWGVAAMATIGRSTFESRPKETYFIGQVLGLVAAVPLWLMLNPKIEALRRPGRHPYLLVLRVVLLSAAILVYVSGCWEGVRGARINQRNVTWAQSCLRYFPALDHHELYIYPYEDLKHLKDEILAPLAGQGVFSDYLNATPFTIPVPTTFVIEGAKDVEILENGPHTFLFVVTGDEPSVLFKASRKINKRHVVLFSTETSAPMNIRFCWNDGAEAPPEKSIELDRNQSLTTVNSGYFPEGNRADPVRPVESIELKPVTPLPPGTHVAIRDLNVLTR